MGTMRIYKLIIHPLTSFRTPLQSDTIFGHLLWALRYTEGEGALTDFLDRCRAGEPPLLVSAGFPSDTLPVPVLPPEEEEREEEKEQSLASHLMEDMLRKAREEARYLPLEQWRRIAGRLSVDALNEARREASEKLRRLRETETMHPVTRTAVDRVTGSAREGRLFVSLETFYGPGRKFDVWHKLDERDDELPGRVSEWWRWVERNGFGRRKSAGHGAFRIESEGLVEAGGELPRVEIPNGFVTLSAWVPRRGDPTDVTYRTRVKRGKLAEALALPSPWKKPLLMLEPGAVACLCKKEKGVREWYGGLIEDVHWTEECIVQYGYAFPLPVCLEEGA
jgi:CRISPR-associated protein Csm4